MAVAKTRPRWRQWPPGEQTQVQALVMRAEARDNARLYMAGRDQHITGKAEAAIKAANEQVDPGYAIGLRFRRAVAAPHTPPRTINFAFNHSNLDAARAAASQDAADYRRAHPDATLDPGRP
jgi:hypothetical protein